MSEDIRSITEQGWTDTPFILSEAERAEYAQLANTVISIALENPGVKESLEFELNPGKEAGTVRTGMFGIGYPRNSVDEKVYLHTGYQSFERADAVIPERQQPKVMNDFWEANEAMLREVERSASAAAQRLGAEAVTDTVFTDAFNRRNVHLRTVRYTNALVKPVGEEVVSGHADLGLMTLHLYETHGGWFYGAPYTPDIIFAPDSAERREQVRAMRSTMRPLEQREATAPFFLGANWHDFYATPQPLRKLPACYHAGFRPDPSEEQVSEFADWVKQGRDDRISVISFMHPNGDLLKDGKYVPATVSNCRPEY